MRQIGVTIRVALKPDLDNPNNWQEHDQIPQPANEQVRATLSNRKSHPRQCDYENSGNSNWPKAEMTIRMWIPDRKIDRPENLPDVRDIGDKRVLEAPGERQLFNRFIRTDLDDECN